MSESIYEKLGRERKEQQLLGKYPDWFTTGGYQMFKESYEYKADGYSEQIRRIAKTLAKYAPTFLKPPDEMYERITKNHGNNWEDCFYNIMWNGDFAPSTPVLGNTGTDRGCSVSCSGQWVGDSVEEFYSNVKEAALLSKQGFGTSAYLGGIRPRGSPITAGGKATGSKPVLEDFQIMSSKVSQGGLRRGAVACYLPIEHGDYDEWADDLLKNPQGQNIGWNFSKDVINRYMNGDLDIDRRVAKSLQTRMIVGKGYWWKPDHVADQQPPCYKKHGLSNKASNLC